VTATLLAFGWLLIAPTEAHSDDPISVAAQEIKDLKDSVDDLGYKDQFNSLIDIAENKYDFAVDAKQDRGDAYAAHTSAVSAEATALEEKTTAETNKTNQQAVVDAAYNDYLDAELAFDIAVINSDMAHQELQSAGVNGLASTVYYLERSGSVATVGDETGCYGTLTQNSFSAGGSLTCGIQENIIIKLTGQITVPSWFTTTKFAGYTDDGFRMYVDGQLAVDNWVDQSVGWSPYSPIYDVSVDKTLDVEIWYYNGSAGGQFHLGWAIPGGWTGAGCDYAGNPRVWGENFSCNLNTFSTGPGANQEQIDAYNSAYAAQMAATTVRDNKLTTYNTELEAYNSLVSVLNTKTTAYNAKVAETDAALTAKNNAITDYTNSLYDLEDAITDASVYYEAQLKRELNIAIANAAAAQAAADAAKAQADAKAAEETRIQAEAKAKAEAEAKARAEEKAKQEAEAKSKVDAEAKAKAEEENRIRVEQESKEKARAEERERQDAEERAKGEAEAKAKAEAEANKPKPKPTDEPKPEPTDEPVIEPIEEPTPEPSPEPGPEPEPEENPWTEPDVEIEDKVLTALVPEKGTGTTEDLSGVIANLTSKDNKLVKLSPEQTAAVSQTLKALTVGAKVEIASDLGIAPAEVAKIAEQMADSPALAEAFVEFAERAGDAGETPMPFTLADAVTEVQTEAFLADPLGAVFEVDVTELLSNFSELGMDMTDDQREKAQEVIVPVILVSQIAGAVMRRNK
jgi:hypothetical protein